MAAILREVLTVTGTSLSIYTQGMSRCGIGISGTWTGTVPFSASLDGLNYIPISVAPFPTGTGQQSTTVNGNFEVQVKNFMFVRCGAAPYGGVTLASGAIVVTMAASIDSSYQDAYLASTSKYVSQSVGGGAQNQITINAQANRAWRCRTLCVGFSAAAAAAVDIQISDGSSAVLWEGFVPVSAGAASAGGFFTVPLPTDANVPGVVGGGVVNTPGNSLVITLAAPGGSIVSKVNAEIYAA